MSILVEDDDVDIDSVPLARGDDKVDAFSVAFTSEGNCDEVSIALPHDDAVDAVPVALV